eukprot:4385514-Alexandrium_andersonii.AAC.1
MCIRDSPPRSVFGSPADPRFVGRFGGACNSQLVRTLGPTGSSRNMRYAESAAREAIKWATPDHGGWTSSAQSAAISIRWSASAGSAARSKTTYPRTAQ